MLGRCHTGASWAGDEAFCSVSFLFLAGFWWVFCRPRLVTLVCFAAADFFATTFTLSSALIFFAAWIVSSFAASSASKDWLRKGFGMSEVMPKAAE